MSVSGVDATSSGRVRRRWSAEEKRAMVMESYEVGKSVSIVARRYGICPSRFYYWRKQIEEGSLVAIQSNGGVVSAAKHQALERRAKNLERLLGRKAEEYAALEHEHERVKMDRDILRDAVRISGKKN